MQQIVTGNNESLSVLCAGSCLYEPELRSICCFVDNSNGTNQGIDLGLIERFLD